MARGGHTDLTAEVILYGDTQPRSGANPLPELDEDGVAIGAKCEKCGSDKGRIELGECAYNGDVNNDPSPSCNCCPDCYAACGEDI